MVAAPQSQREVKCSQHYEGQNKRVICLILAGSAFLPKAVAVIETFIIALCQKLSFE